MLDFPLAGICCHGIRSVLIVQPPSIDPLIAELKAIELWDHFYAATKNPGDEELLAWKARRERQATIYEQLVALETYLPAQWKIS
jgi:hypothetical protein